MFSPEIVESDAFLEMPQTSQNLYFHLGMYADDDGFVSPKKIMRLMNATDDDLRVLLGKRFLLNCDNGVVVIKHWRINNFVRRDRYRPTLYTSQRTRLLVKPDGVYTDDSNQGKEFNLVPWKSDAEKVGQPDVNQLVDHWSTQDRLGKDRLGKDRLGTREEGKKSIQYLREIPEVDMQEFLERFVVAKEQIESKAEDLMLYCERNGKRYKNYKSFLLNALKRDFPPKKAATGKYKDLA